MTILKEMVLIGEIVSQSKIAQRAAQELQLSNEKFNQLGVWSSIQLILISAGNVSKILWNSKYKNRSEQLRNLLNVADDNLLSNRKFRNHFEHYDERIENWFENQSSAVYKDLEMNPSMTNSEQVNKKNNRGYNSFNNTIIFRGESLNLNEVLKALEEINHSCAKYVLP